MAILSVLKVVIFDALKFCSKNIDEGVYNREFISLKENERASLHSKYLE